jgi:RNA polymerase sigma-70 factor (ECF subfamily)
MQAVSDEQLIEWVARGDSSCLGTLFERHNRGVFQYCRQLTRNSEHAEDLTQEVFLKILRKAGSFRSEGTFKAWMFNIARNVTFDYLRKTNREGQKESIDESASATLVDHRSAEQAAAGTQYIDILSQALANLPAAIQEVIWLGRFEFDSYEELGLALGCKTGTARVRMHRAMQLLNTEFATINGAPIDV